MARQSKIFWILFCALIVLFLFLYFSSHGFGAWSDDSPGYVLPAARLLQGKSAIYQDEWVKHFIPKLSLRQIKFLLPTHYSLLNQQGWIAPKYPMGLSWLLWLWVNIFRADVAFYFLFPFLGVANLLAIFWLTNLLFKNKWLGLLAAFVLGTSSIYWLYSIAYPLRETVSITFILFCAVFWIKSFSSKKALIWVILAGLFFGYALNIRTTNVIFALALAGFSWPKIRKKAFLKLIPIFILAVVLAYSLSIFHTHTLNQLKSEEQPTKLTPDIQKVGALHLRNYFNNQGKYKTGQGSLVFYIQDVIPKITFIPGTILLALLALGYLFYKKRYSPALGLLLWPLSYLFLFSAWPNPYERYILPLFPAVVLLCIFGLYLILRFLGKIERKRRVLAIVVTIIALIACHAQAWARIKQVITYNNVPDLISEEDPEAIQKVARQTLSQEDFLEIKNIKNNLGQGTILFCGRWINAFGETLEAHSQIKWIVLPPFEEDAEYDLISFLKDLTEFKPPVYVWFDATSNPLVKGKIFSNFDLEFQASPHFSFIEQVEIYKIIQIY